jgi:pyruvate,water dikinase
MNTAAHVAGPEPALVARLARFARGDLAVAGGKGANLAELVRAGFAVPDGFVVTTAAYDHFVAHNGLAPPAGAEAAGALQSAFEAGKIPPEVARAVRLAYEQLGGGPVAVRSSATAEDLPEAAFAGQQDTFLNVAGAEAVLAAVRGCWASLWSERAIAYRARQGVDEQAVKLAVVVQRMVFAEAAGVLFTANPVTGARDEIVVDASPGLGEAVVAGLVTPDHFVLRRRRGLLSGWTRGWAIVARRPGRRELIVRARPEGGTERVAAAAPAEGAPAESTPPERTPPERTPPESALPDRALRELARQGAAIQAHFGSPQDVEWAWAGGRLTILQARPLTALPEPPPRPSRPVAMLAALYAEMFPVRPYPFDLNTWLPAISEAAVVPLFTLLGVTPPALVEAFSQEDGVAVTFTGDLPLRPTLGILLAPWRILWLAWRYDPARSREDPELLAARARVRVLAARDLETLSWDSLIASIHETLALPLPLAGAVRRRYYPRAVLAAGLLRVVLGLLGRADRFGALLSGADSLTAEANRALEALAARARSDPALAGRFAAHEGEALWAALEADPAGRSFLAALRDFLERYGHREAALSTVLEPTWTDAPLIALGIVRGLAQAAPPPAPRPVWQQAEDDVRAHPLLRLPVLRAAVRRLIGTARQLWRIREDSHLDATSLMPVLRRTALELGRRLTAAGVLGAPVDVFHLQLAELERAGDPWPPPAEAAGELRAIVQRRKERRAALAQTPLVDPRFYRPAEGGQGAEGALLRGTPGSPGVAEGPARVIRDATEFGRLQPGDVLVAPFTNPAWTVLFTRAAAVVVDGGGAGSHAAIVAREYGIPAVMGTSDGTRRLADGRRLRVDGSRGLVFGADAPAGGD